MLLGNPKWKVYCLLQYQWKFAKLHVAKSSVTVLYVYKYNVKSGIVNKRKYLLKCLVINYISP